MSNDNPFSEARFKTLEYHPGYPRRFASKDAALACCRRFFPWYNEHHRHGGIALLTPDDVYYGRADALLVRRQRRLFAAYEAHSERFPNGLSVVQSLPNAVCINPPSEDGEQSLAKAR